MIAGVRARWTARAVREFVSRRTRFRGSYAPDGKISLLTVNWHTNDFAVRLVRSFRSFVSADLPVVVVDNSPSRGARQQFRDLGARYVTTGTNLGHGLGLDLGMCFVNTEFALVCDPDTAVVGPEFGDEIMRRLDARRVAAVDTGNPHYHPLCVAFASEYWKRGGFSFQARWPFWDVGGELTHLLGGVQADSLIPKSRSFGVPLRAAFGGDGLHYLGEVYGDTFSSTYLAGRLNAEPGRQDFDGWPRSVAVAYHERWTAWVEDLLAGSATVAEFPTSIHGD